MIPFLHLGLRVLVLSIAQLLVYLANAYPPDFPLALLFSALAGIFIFPARRKLFNLRAALIAMMACFLFYVAILLSTTVVARDMRFQIGFGMSDWTLQPIALKWKAAQIEKGEPYSALRLIEEQASFNDLTLPSLWKYRWGATFLLVAFWVGFGASLGAVTNLLSPFPSHRPFNGGERAPTKPNIDPSSTPSGSTTKSVSARFAVALSFPNEHRDFVLNVAESLAGKLTRARVFYDEWYEAELLGVGGDLKLQSMYKKAEIVVPFFSQNYSKPWCALEWETIRGILLTRRNDDSVIPVHLDDTEIPGWSAVNFGIRLRERGPEQIADLILQVLTLRNDSGSPTTTRDEKTGTGAPPIPQPAVAKTTAAAMRESGALPIWKEKLDYLLQQEAIESNAAAKFAIMKQIEEAKRMIAELGG